MKHFYNSLFAFWLIAIVSLPMKAQEQLGEVVLNNTIGIANEMYVGSFKILDDPALNVGCSNTIKYSVDFHNVPGDNPSTTDKAYWPALPGGTGMKQFTAQIDWKVWAGYNNYRFYYDTWNVYINGTLCSDCWTETVGVANILDCGNSPVHNLTVHYPATDEYDTNGEWEFALSPRLASAYDCNTSWDWDCVCYAYNGAWGTDVPANESPEIRFNAIMVGVSFTEVLGTFTTPQTLTCILRDPPGDLSYSTWSESTEQCFGSSFFVSNSTEESSYLKVEYGFGVPGIFDATIEGVLSASMEETTSETNEVQTCVQAITATQTNAIGKPDDLFIGNALLYNYGMASTISRENCVSTKVQGLAVAPLSQVTSFKYPESEIRNTKIPQLESIIAILTPGSFEWENSVAQLEVWQQALAMNDAIKAEALAADVPAELFVSGATQTLEVTTTTTESKVIDMKVRLSAGIDLTLTTELPFFDLGVEAGAEINFRTEYGHSESSSLEYSNTSAYSMSDNDAGVNDGNDNFKVNIMQDNVFGTFVFALDSAYSNTSCPYEGGTPIELPQLWVGTEGETTMVIEDILVEETAEFPIMLCNENPTRAVSYYLTMDVLSNNNNAVVVAFGNNLAEGNNPPILIQPNTCATGTLLLTQPSASILDFNDIEVLLTSTCEPLVINSSIFISAHYTTVGVSDLNNRNNDWFLVTPNPSTGVFRVVPVGNSKSMTVTISDLSGRVVIAPRLIISGSNPAIDLSSLANGTYVLLAECEGESRTSRLLVEN